MDHTADLSALDGIGIKAGLYDACFSISYYSSSTTLSSLLSFIMFKSAVLSLALVAGSASAITIKFVNQCSYSASLPFATTSYMFSHVF